MNPLLKRWDVAPRVPAGVLRGWPTIIVQILHNRGISDPAEVEAFLRDDDSLILDPFSLRGMDRAVERVSEAVARQETVAIFGDFDVDGVTSAALLWEVLRALGVRTLTHIPNRAEEGYGVNIPALVRLRGQGATLLITVDCGISAVDEIAAARNMGLDVIITDHHQVPRPVPDASVIINPRQACCSYAFKELAGVGVAFKLAQALLSRLPLQHGRSRAEIEKSLLDLVALGTVADVAPLLGENRALVRRGLRELSTTARPGLRQLIARAGLRPGCISSHNISYALGPRLNAAGRLHDAFVSYRLLTTDSEEEARMLAEDLEATNQERQRLTEDALSRARDEIAAGGHVPKLLVVSGAEYPSGVVGLVAGKLMEEFYRPVVVVELRDEESRGSARSIAELDITEALSSCNDLLSRYGGHARAAGFAIPNHNLDVFKDRLLTLVETRFEGMELRPSLYVDREVSFREIGWDLHRLLGDLEPFGFGNPVPTFLTRRVRAVEARVVGHGVPSRAEKGEHLPEKSGAMPQTQKGASISERKARTHLRLRLSDGHYLWNAIAFGLGELAGIIMRKEIDVVYSLAANEWNGQVSLQLHVKDLRISD
ncbi:MAG: single-stranded-DNA-specific exonuclease RecJ [Chloroflexi bacterium]|nr:single-stranded-DNA-specific exonuclease RecJ [Chloroflexota bacterium]